MKENTLYLAVTCLNSEQWREREREEKRLGQEKKSTRLCIKQTNKQKKKRKSSFFFIFIDFIFYLFIYFFDIREFLSCFNIKDNKLKKSLPKGWNLDI